MKKMKFCVILLSTLGMSTSFAMQQTVRLCLYINDNPLGEMFTASVNSSDFFDFGNHINAISNGSQCVHHVYRSGPKNLRLHVKASKPKNRNVNIVLDQSCYYFHNQSNNAVVSDYLRSDNNNEFWHLTISQIPLEGSSSTYRLSCEYHPS